jgi:flavin-dependent dehydrogenase
MKINGLRNITIIGAGPSGLTFAYHALKNNINVKIYEGRKTFAFKPCGEALAGDALEVLSFKLGYRYKWMLSDMRYVKLYYNGIYYRTIKSPFGEKGFIINKREFLQNLADIVEKEGGKIFMGNFYKGKEENADLIIDSSGYLTFSRSYAREVYKKEYRLIPVIRDYAESNDLLEEGYLLIDLLDKGYFWIFPYGKDQYNVGIGGLYDGNTLKKIYEKKIKQFGLKLIKNTRQGASVSIGGLISKRNFGKYYIIGEAAGYVMPTTGEGIRFSIFSAYEFFNPKENYVRNLSKRIQFNAKLLRLAININSRLKSKLIERAPEDLILVFLGEKNVNVQRILLFLRTLIKEISIKDLRNALFSLYDFLLNERVELKENKISNALAGI